MKTKILISIIFSLFVLSTNAQNSSDALNYSQTFNEGTARFTSMGGAFGALGGDFSSISLNPAGLGVYRSSEFTLTPSFKSRTINSVYNGETGVDARGLLNLENIGFVYSYKPAGDRQTGLVNMNIAFGYNKTKDFNSYAVAKGYNSDNSIMDIFADQAYGFSPSELDFHVPKDNFNPYYDEPYAPWGAIMAWRTYLIDPAVGGGYIRALNNGDKVLQRNSISTAGSSGDYLFSMGFNISNKIYLGTTLTMQGLNYSYSAAYGESASGNDTLETGDRFNSLVYNQNFETVGKGYNLKIGGIYKPFDGLRIGLALHTPTYYKLQDTYSYSLSSDVHYGTISETSPNGRYDYQLETPFKAIASIAYTFKGFGLISIDVEHVNYTSMRLRNEVDGSAFTDANDAIDSTYINVNNIKIGGEVKINDFFLRGGYAFYPSPYKKGSVNENANRSIISGGIGYRSGNFFIDAAYLYSMQNEKYYFYNVQYDNYSIATKPTSTKMTEGKFLVTVGLKF